MRKINIIFCFLVLSVYAYAQDYVSISNGYVSVTADKTTGRFSIGEPEDIALTDGFYDEPHFCHCNLYFDGNVYSNQPGIGVGDILIDSVGVYGSGDDEYIFVEWHVGPILGWFHYKLQLPDSLKSMVYMEGLAYNSSLDLHIVGLFQYMDIKVNHNDNPQLYLPTGVFYEEAVFNTYPIPAFYVAFEESLHQDTSFAYSEGVIFGRSGIPIEPMKIAFSNSSRLEINEWNFVSAGEELEDLAVGIWWPLRELEAYEFYQCANYYGGGYPGAQPFVKETHKPIAESFELDTNYPNPFNASTTIPFKIHESGKLKLIILDINGRTINTLVDQNLVPGSYKVVWNCKDEQNIDVPTGVYFCRMESSQESKTKKMILLK
ncbi:T9SS type A sorting domain-containing protein [bacterium]|nr:T9SS type A sorting domain-containing protein [bacterium]